MTVGTARVIKAFACVAFSLLAGCVGGLQATPPPTETTAQSIVRTEGRFAHPGFVSSAEAIPALHSNGNLIFKGSGMADVHGYVSASSVFGAVELWALPDSKNNAPVCSINTEYVQGLGFDSKGTLWVPTPVDPTTGTGFVYTYPTGGCTAAPFTLNAAAGQPADIAFGAKDVYVSYIIGLPNGTYDLPASIDVFAKNKTTASANLSNPAIYQADGIAVDDAGDVFWSGSSGNTYSVVKFGGGKGSGTVLGLTGFGALGGLEFDKKQNLIAADAGNTTLDIWSPPYSGSPTTIALKGTPLQVKLDKANKYIYVSDLANGTVDVYTYPKGKYEFSISNGFTTSGSYPLTVAGVAVSLPSRD